MQNAAEDKGLLLQLSQSAQLPRYIDADAPKLRQVLINLLNNALKFTAEGGVTLRLRAEPLPEDELVEFIFEIEDSGIGIDSKQLSRIFQPFIQLEDSVDQGGTGLGLAIVRQYVELMEGKIEVESELGTGSIFRVTLPVGLANKAEIVQTESAMGDVVKLEPGQTDWRVLIVEDNSDSLLLLKTLLEGVGFEVHAALNGVEAIKLFEEWQPHFIWMNRRMPLMDGLTATKEIRKLPGGKEVKVVALTASAFEKQKVETMEAGLDDFIRKPFHAKDIFECMAKHLGVRYIYEERDAQTTDIPLLEIQPEALAGLPEALLLELEGAIRALDVESTREVIARIAAIDSDLAKALQQRIDELDFSAIGKFWD